MTKRSTAASKPPKKHDAGDGAAVGARMVGAALERGVAQAGARVVTVGRIVSFEYEPSARHMPRIYGSERVMPAIVVKVRDEERRVDLRVFQSSDSPPILVRNVGHGADEPPGFSNWLWPDERARVAAGESLEDPGAGAGEAPAMAAILDELVNRVADLEAKLAALTPPAE